MLACYAIPVVETYVARTAEEAVEIAEKVGYPLVIKIFSETITHKSDVGGVKLNIRSHQAVRDAFKDIHHSVTEAVGEGHFQGVTVQKITVKLDGYELILGSSVDPQFGPVLLFGMGGQLVERFKDRALALPPLNINLARRLMEKTRIYQALKGVLDASPSIWPPLKKHPDTLTNDRGESLDQGMRREPLDGLAGGNHRPGCTCCHI